MTTNAVQFVPDEAGLAAILRSAAVHELVMDRARGGAAFAARIAPRRTGQYAAEIHAEDAGLGGPHHDRPMGLVVASAPYSAAVEWGNAHQDHPHHVLGQTLGVVTAG